MSTPANIPKNVQIIHFAESEAGLWDSESDQLLDPRPIEARQYIVSPENESGWGFHGRAERLNGRLAMLGFGIGRLIEALSGSGILQQMGHGALLPLR